MSFISSKNATSNKILQYNSELAEAGKNKEFQQIYEALILQKDLSIGKIYLQNGTDAHWFIGNNSNTVSAISKAQLDLFYKWDERELLPTDVQFDELVSIGGIPIPDYPFAPKSITFPTKVKTINGKVIDTCIIQFSSFPPPQRYFKNTLLFDEISEIYPSELALSHEIRLVSILTDEIRMGFYPLMVETRSGKLLTYNGLVQFASTDGSIKGSDIICTVPLYYEKMDKIINIESDNITCILGKWDNRFENLYDQYNKTLSSLSKPEVVIQIKAAWWQKLLQLFSAKTNE